MNFVFACDTGCENSQNISKCYNYGDSEKIGNIFFFCDSEVDAFSEAKENGAECVNNFECSIGYCVSGICNGYYADIIQVNDVLSESAPGLCPEFEDTTGTYFCSDSLFVANAVQLTTKTCGIGSYCFKCNSSAYTYNSVLDVCTKGMCEATEGQFCMNNTISNSTEKEGYSCLDSKKCYSCDEDFYWNNSLSKCIMNPCTSSPGCMNISNLTNGQIVENRLCNVGTCFVCKSGYKWNLTVSSCVLSSTGGSTSWSSVSFSSSELSTDTYKSMSAGDRVMFSFTGKNYYFGLYGADTRISFSISPDSSFTVSTIKNQIMYIGESRPYDLNSDGTYDFRVSLKNISNGDANISLKIVSEPYASGASNSGSEIDYNVPDGSNTDSSFDSSSNSGTEIDLGTSPVTESFIEKNLWLIMMVVILVIILIILLVVYLMNQKTKPSSSATTNPVSVQQRPPVMPGNAPMGYPVGGYRPLPQRPVMPQNPQVRR